MSKRTFFRKAGVHWGVLFGVVLVVFMFMTQMIPTPVLKEDLGSWHLVWQGSLAEAAEGSPGVGASGFLEVFFINHSASPDTAYNENSSAVLEGWCVVNMPGKTPYANADNFLVELDYGVLFDIVIRCRWNKTHTWDGTKFISANVRVNITLTGFNTVGMSDIVGSQVVTRNDTSDDFFWANYYWQDVDGAFGAGYTINKGALWSANQITMIKIWAKY